MKNENGITLLSLVITVIVLSILASLLVSASIKNNPAMETVNSMKDFYANEQSKTKKEVDRVTNGWENVIL